MGEDNFDDGETNFGGGKSDSLSFNSILMRHLERITRLASVEFKGGYSQQKTIPVAGTLMQQDVYVADTRECYINAIENLSDLLLPNFDEQMTKAEEECIAEIEEKINPSEMMINLKMKREKS